MTTLSLNFCKILGAAGAPTVTPQGAAGAATWGYKIVGVDANGGTTAAGAEGTTAGGNATLDGANFNRITWTDPLNCTSVKIYRTTSGGTPASLGLIGTVLAGVQTFDDTGIAGDASTAPASDTTGLGTETSTGSLNSLWVSIDGTFVATLQVQARIGTSWVNTGSAATAPAHVQVAAPAIAVRIKNTAFTSGTPVATLAYRRLGKAD